MSVADLSGVSARPGSAWASLQRFARTPKGTLLVVFVPLLALGALGQGPRHVLPNLLCAVGAACFVEIAATWGVGGKWQFPSSALLSGTIVASVLSPDDPWAVAVAAGALATASKYVVRTRREHIFNPAALALLLVILVFGASDSWWGALTEQPWPLAVILLAGGAIVADRTNKMPQVLIFLATYFLLFTVVGLVNATAVAEMFRDPYAQAVVFLACFMLTDPPTSPARYVDQVWFGVLAASVSVVAELAGAGEAYLLVGLLAANAALALHRHTRRLAVA